MRIFTFLLSAIITTTLLIALNTRFGQVPAFGTFLNPFSGFWQNADSERRFSDIQLQLPGLKHPAEVRFDERMVPHIFAQSDEDLYYLQGYVTAKYRLWQMETQTHNAAGRVSEIIGKKTLDNDRLNRRIGLAFGAENSTEFILGDTQSQKMLGAYCAGVNAFISQLAPKDYPIEYKLLGYAPEAWTPLKTALLLKNMANMLSVYEYDIENTNFINRFGEEQFHYLYPEKDSFIDYIIPVGTKFTKTEIPLNNTEGVTLTNPREAMLYKNIIQKPTDLNGSNNWAVSGEKTKTGKPILCNDPHLQLNLPSIWYEMHLVSPTCDVYGATLPGAPCVISGFNKEIAWGVTNGGRDVRDWFKITFKDDSHNEYLLDGKWAKTQKRIEHIKVRGGEEFLDTVLYTRFGPVVFDQSFGDVKMKQFLAMKWTAHQGSNEFMTFYKMNRGGSYEDYLEALKHYSCPTQNFVFASRSGDIAIKQQGKHPLTHQVVADGSLSSSDWLHYIPDTDNPLVRNPPRQFVSSANQFPFDATYPYPVSHVGIYEEQRAIRINRMLEEGQSIDATYMMKMQNDNYNITASLALPAMLAALHRSDFSSYQNEISLLEQWNYRNDSDSKGATLFEAWATELYEELWDEMADVQAPMKRPNWYRTAYFLRNDSNSIFYDNLQTGERENREILLNKTFDVAMKKLRQENKPLEWGQHKATGIRHLAKLDAFSKLNVICGGNRGIVNATNSTHGPSWRMIVDFGNNTAHCLFPGGESGNPGSRFYDNMIDKWARGEYYEARITEKEKVKSLFTMRVNSK
ncbi:MAG: penicillin acylase family protein [Chitinophagales bacterium]